MHRIFFIVLFIISNSLIYSQLPAFPTAYGSGAYVTGGRGQTVYHVTSLADSGSGSFRQALIDAKTNNGGTIVFDVSGVINLSSHLQLSNASNITIAGQTAPEGGITIDGESVLFNNVENVICRYIRFKGGIDSSYFNGGPTNSFQQKGDIVDVIFDHCSFMFGYFQGGSWYETGDERFGRVTIQRSLFAHNDRGALSGKQSGGSNAEDGTLSWISNLFYNVTHRAPNVSGDDARIDVINNVSYYGQSNGFARISQVQGRLKLNHIGNYHDRGNSLINDNTINPWGSSSDPSIYTNDNKIIAPVVGGAYPMTYSVSEMNANNTLMFRRFYSPQGTTLPSSYFSDTQHPPIGRSITPLNVDEAFIDVYSDVGCNARLNADGSVSDNTDSLDADVLSNVENGIRESRLSLNSTDMAVPPITSNSRPGGYYNTNPHIPEAWLISKGYPQTSTIHNETAPSGYTYLEEFLNQVDGEQSNRPIITRTDSNPTTIEVGGTYIPPTGTWTDVEDGTGVATVGGDTVDVNIIDTYNVTLEHTDLDGNTGSLIIPIEIVAEIVNASGVTVSPATVNLEELSTTQLSVAFTPSNTADQSGVWNSDDTNIATVNQSGLVTGIAEGTTTITFTSNDGSFTDTSIITVTAQVAPAAALLESAVRSGNDYVLTFSQPVGTGVPLGGYYTYINGSPQYDNDLGFTRTITGLDTSVDQTFSIDARYTQYNPSQFYMSNEITVSAVGSDVVNANAGVDKVICENESVTLTASGGLYYLWSTGETTQSITVSPLETTSYTVTVSNDLVSDTDDVVVTVNPIPIAYAGEERAILSGDSIPLTASGGSEFLWSTGETTQEIIVSPMETTTYTVEVFENGCSDIASVSVIVGVSASVGGEQTICQGQSTILYASGGSYFEWNTGETTQSIEVSPSQTTTYSVIVSNNSSSDEAEITVNVNLVPAADAGEDVTIESGQNVTLTASGGNSYSWSTGETTQSISVSPSDTTVYTVETFVNGCSNTDDVKVTVVQQVNASAGDNVEICLGESTTLTASGGNSYSWSTGETTQSISVSPSETTSYSVEVSNGFSTQSADVMVGVLDCQAIDSEPEDSGFEFRVFPNPTKNNANIKLVGLENVSSIFISNLNGHVLSSESFEPNNGHVINKRYDLSSLARGIYLITFKQIGKPAVTKKLILK